MAPTTMIGQTTTTSPGGREPLKAGYPIKMAEIIANLEGTAYSARVSVHDAKHLMTAKKTIRKAFDAQLERRGLGFVELLSSCPTNWKMTSQEANKRVKEELVPYFPLGVYKDTSAKGDEQ